VASSQLPAASWITLVVCDVLGREVAVLVNEKKDAGRYSVSFDASGLPSGIYFCRLAARQEVSGRSLESFSSKKMVLAK
jgi:hypothetical protein